MQQRPLYLRQCCPRHAPTTRLKRTTGFLSLPVCEQAALDADGGLSGRLLAQRNPQHVYCACSRAGRRSTYVLARLARLAQCQEASDSIPPPPQLSRRRE